MDNSDKDRSAFVEKQFPDEIPRFSLSPGRSISPIDDWLDLDQNKSLSLDDDVADEELDQLCQPLSLNFVSLCDIDAQITPLKAKGLQTIFEGVFLETPPRSGGRTVFPRMRKCDSSSSSSGSSDDEEDQMISPLGESYEPHDVMRLEETEIIMSRRRSSNKGNNGTIQEQLVVTATISTDEEGTTATLTSLSNSFQKRQNLIPGED